MSDTLVRPQRGGMVPATADAVNPIDPYAFNPGYYDLLRAKDGDTALPSPRFFADLVPENGSVLEIGSGTGRITLELAERAGGVWCLDRSVTMRAVLLAKLAQRPDLWDRVTVLAGSALDFKLDRTFDFICMAGVLEHVSKDDRPGLFRAISDHLVPGGIAAMDMVLTEPALEMPDQVVDEVTVGECRYTFSIQADRIDPDLSHLHMTYRTHYQGEVVATEVVERLHNLHRPDAVLRDLAEVGLVPAEGSGIAMATGDPDDPGAVVVRKPPEGGVA
ncbi:MAG: class I SAM-dependent methyltransferase [Actinoallomurus sp.]